TTVATRIGLRMAPTCPDVFIAALTAPDRRPPMSTQVPHAAPSRKFDEAPPKAMRTAAATGEATKAPMIVNTPANARAPPPRVTGPARTPSRRRARSVATRPRRWAGELRIRGRPARIPAVIPVRPRDARYVGSHVT